MQKSLAVSKWNAIAAGLLEQLEFKREQLEAVLQQMPAAIIIAKAPAGKLILGNEQVQQIWRQPFLASDNMTQYHQWKGFHPDGRRYAATDWPLARSLARGEVVIGEERISCAGTAPMAQYALASRREAPRSTRAW